MSNIRFEPNEIHIDEQFHMDDQFQMEREMAGMTIFKKCQLTTKTITNLDMQRNKAKMNISQACHS